MAPPRPGVAVLDPRAAWLGHRVRVPAADSVGQIAAETLSPYPPGIPAVLPGERLTPQIVAELRATVEAGGVVRGAVDGLRTIAIVDAGRPAAAPQAPPGRRAVRRRRVAGMASWSR
ncbi:MAG: hypothetical protein ABI611_12650 [Solirubrobacteraceae bacterium]